jgi:hypothetical protein
MGCAAEVGGGEENAEEQDYYDLEGLDTDFLLEIRQRHSWLTITLNMSSL